MASRLHPDLICAVGANHPGGEAAPNLEYSTRSDSPGYSCTLLDFGDCLEFRAVYVPHPLPKCRKSTSERLERLSSCYEDSERFEYRVRRTKRQCRLRCMALGKNAHLWTLGKRGKFDTTDDCVQALAKWVRIIQGWSDKDFRYVAVPEQHADGKWHIHLAVPGFWDVKMLRRFWYRALGGTGLEGGGDTPGSVNIARQDGVRRNVTARVAGYMAKYMAKSFHVLGNGKKSYWCSKGLVANKIIRFRHPIVINRIPILEFRKICEQYRKGRYTVYEWDFAGTTGITIRGEYA